MKKQKNNTKTTKKDNAAKERPHLLIKRIALVLFMVGLIALGIRSYHVISNSELFIVKEARLAWQREPLDRSLYTDLASLGQGENIFSYDISSVAAKILVEYPLFKDLEIVKDFPDRLTLKIEPRVAVAQVGDKDFFLVDDEGVMLTNPSNSIRENLPIIAGVPWRLFRKVGQPEGSHRITRALNLLNDLEGSGFLKEHTLSKIDISDYRNVSFTIEDGLEVKVGHTDFQGKIARLVNTLNTMNIDKARVTYIDLRFDDAVLGTR